MKELHITTKQLSNEHSNKIEAARASKNRWEPGVGHGVPNARGARLSYM